MYTNPHHRYYGCLLVLIAVLGILSFSQPLPAQDTAPERDEITTTGTVASSSRNTLVVRSDRGLYQLYVFERSTRRPATLPVGSQVSVTSTASDERGIRVAREVTVTQAAAAPAAAGGSTANSQAVPTEVRRMERDIERQVRKYQLGVRAGVALDPELLMVGVHGQVGPFFNSDIFLRPSVEFGFGEVTALFGLNLEAIYRLPISSRQGRWTSYVGAGPGFNFIHQNFDRTTGEGKRIDFGDFHSDTGLNILGGIRYRSGMFTELKTSVYTTAAPTLRIIVGYNF